MIRRARYEDVEQIMSIIGEAQRWFCSMGINQWQDGYPTSDIIQKDIDLEQSYLLEEQGEVVATAVISFAEEPTYREIYEGEWLNKRAYAVVHRMAVKESLKGGRLAARLLDYAEQLCKERGIGDIRIDTHIDNLSMQRLIARQGFIHCGRIVLESGDDREAYQKSW